MLVVRGANHHGIQAFLIETLPPVPIRLGVREGLERLGDTVVVHVAKGRDVFVRQRAVVCGPPAPHADERHIQFVACCILAGPRAAWEDDPAGTGGGHGLYELPSFHARIIGPFAGDCKRVIFAEDRSCGTARSCRYRLHRRFACR